MKPKHKIQITSVFVLLALLFFMTIGTIPAAAATYESESNNTYSTSDPTADDIDSYGSIGSSSDIDWWRINFASDGVANFYLGNIPSACDYDLYLYKNNGTNMIARSEKSGNKFELIRARIQKNVMYYVKIVSHSGSSNSNYLFRSKRYDLSPAKYFSCDVERENGVLKPETYTRVGASIALPYLWEMGYGADEFLNNNVIPAYNVLPSTSICVFHNHSLPGKFTFITDAGAKSYLYASTNSSMTSQDRSIESYAAGALSNVDLLLLMGCESGLSSTNGYGNLVSAAQNKGVKCAVGWNEAIIKSHSVKWIELFFENSINGKSVENTLLTVHTTLERSTTTDFSDILNYRYAGAAESIVI